MLTASFPGRAATARIVLVLLLVVPAGGRSGSSGDPRELYDVVAYRLDLTVDPEAETIRGTAAVEARAVGEELVHLVLDMHAALEAERVLQLPGVLDQEGALAGEPLEFLREKDTISCRLARPARRGETVAVAVVYSGKPRAKNSFDGFHWARTEGGAPWVNTSCQSLGAHSWWPCKASFFHPEDKHERLFVNLTVPRGLVAVSNGRRVGREPAGEGWERFRWRLDHPCPTYAVTLNVAPYVEISAELALPGLERPLPAFFYALPESEEKARRVFADVPRLLEVYSEAFGPWPFPEAKFALVETNFWGMEHSTAIAYGSSFPAWIAEHGGRDRYASRNRFFDYILVHEVAHEWWGNAVSAADWGDFWLHEGFATYAEGVFLERTAGRAEADRWFRVLRRAVGSSGSLYRGKGTTSREAFGGILYAKGAWVLNTLRHHLDDDETWWRTLRAFQLEHRYGNATTEDFRARLEQESGRSWEQFFEEWVYGSGYPSLKGTVTARKDSIVLEIDNPACGETGFHVPVDLQWTEQGEPRRERVVLEPGSNRIEIPCESKPMGLEVVDLDRVLGKHDVRVE